MIAVFYSFGIKLLALIIRIAAFFNPKAKAFILGRRNNWQKLTKQLNGNTAPILWVHCASVGEYEQGRPVMEAFKHNHPSFKIFVTFYSPSGYQAIDTDHIVDFKCYLPFDSKKNANKLITLVNPQLAIFVKYEFWHFYLNELNNRGIPVFSVSSIFRPDQLFFKWYGGFYRQMLDNFTYFFVQDKPSAQLLEKLSLPHAITGDTRLDRVLSIKNNKKSLPRIEAFTSEQEVMVVGSMRKEDISLIIRFIQQYPGLKFIIAPHEITESMMQAIEKEVHSTIRLSQSHDTVFDQQVLIIDNIGMLSQLYRYSRYAYIGGGFSDGIHNILEPAVFEIPVFFGNKDYQRFKEAIDLIDLGAAFPIGSSEEFTVVFDALRQSKERQAAIKSALATYLTKNEGAANKIITKINEYIA